MTYRQLQAALKSLRAEGRIPAGFKLNQKREVLQAMLDLACPSVWAAYKVVSLDEYDVTFEETENAVDWIHDRKGSTLSLVKKGEAKQPLIGAYVSVKDAYSSSNEWMVEGNLLRIAA